MAILFVNDKGTASIGIRLRREAQAGHLRRLYPGLYTDDLATPPPALVRKQLPLILSLLVPKAMVSHRSALEPFVSTSKDIYLTGPYRRTFDLPGVTVHVRKGPGPAPSDISIPIALGRVSRRSSDVRALLENMQVCRARKASLRHVLGQAAIEAWLERFLARRGAPALRDLQDQASVVSEQLGMRTEYLKLAALIETLLGTGSSKLLSPAAIARAQGMPYDVARIELFHKVADYLNANPPSILPAHHNADFILQAFTESYFTNFIEGTEFKLDEAYDLVHAHKRIASREDDCHDILGTFNAILDSVTRPGDLTTSSRFETQLKAWNRQVIFSRVSQKPGEWKDKANRVGQHYFVDPELVRGTLKKSFELLASAASPVARAALAMFLIAEVHPFLDGNGRTARLAMNQLLSNAGLTRIIIPTVFRDDYLSALRALSNDGHAVPYVRMLNRAAKFSAWLNFSAKDSLFEQLKSSNALMWPLDAQLKF